MLLNRTFIVQELTYRPIISPVTEPIIKNRARNYLNNLNIT